MSGPARLALCALLLAAPVVGSELPEVILFPSCAGEVAFPHEMHFSDLGLDCDACHHETRAAALKMPHDEYFDDFWIDCRTCHHDEAGAGEPRSCSGCHRLLPSNIADESLSPKVAIHKSCWQCHEIGTGAAASAGCSTCHGSDRTPH